MKTLERFYETILGCLAVVLFALAVLAVPTQQLRADDPIPCGDPPECPAGTHCVDGYCVPLVLTCQESFCLAGAGGCTTLCAGKPCAAGSIPNPTCTTVLQSCVCP